MIDTPYSSCMTGEQFLFDEMRIVARLYTQGRSLSEIIDTVTRDNLFQYPTEKKYSRIARACHKRITAMDNQTLTAELAEAPITVAKQINLYAIMRYNRLVREFMINLVGEKYRNQDFTITRKDLNVFFAGLQQQSGEVANWGDKTEQKLKQVLIKCLTEVEMLDSIHDTTLNQFLISVELENGIRENGDLTALVAFNCFN